MAEASRTRSIQRRMRRKLLRFAAAYVAIIALGTVGYLAIEGWHVVEALYMTVITLSTVGFNEVRPLSPAGRVFTTALIVAGVGAVTYLFAAVSQYVVSGELTGSIRKARMQQRIDALTGHYIIVGYGRVGRQVIEDLRAAGAPCVVLEQDAEALTEIPDGLPSIPGDGADDEVLVRAGIGRAAGLVASTGDDATNLFVTLSARSLNPELSIVARANHPASEAKLRRAGATHVISPYTISGRRIARQLLTPTVTDFLDVVMHWGGLELLLEECTVQPHGRLAGKTVAEADVRKHTGANVLAIRRRGDGGIVTNLPGELRFEPADVLIALGTAEQLGRLVELAGGTR